MLNLASSATTKLYYAMQQIAIMIVLVRLVIHNLPLSLEVNIVNRSI